MSAPATPLAWSGDLDDPDCKDATDDNGAPAPGRMHVTTGPTTTATG
jgi:hypothetical protein